jgi:hypothetical protein
MIVHHPQWQHAKGLLKSGVIGDLVQVDGVFSYNNRADVTNIRNNATTGGGSLPDIGVYTLGSTRFMTEEEPKEILHSSIVWENGVDVWASVTAQFPSFQFIGVTSMRMQPRLMGGYCRRDGSGALGASGGPPNGVGNSKSCSFNHNNLFVQDRRLNVSTPYMFTRDTTADEAQVKQVL